MILSIIDPTRFTSPLAFPNPRIVGNPGERTLQIRVWPFNPGPEPRSITDPLLVRLGPIQKSFDFPLTVPAGQTIGPIAVVLPIDGPDGNLPDGEYALRVWQGDAESSIIVRLNITDLHLVSPWPERLTPPTPTNEAARAELAVAEAEVTRLAAVIATSQDTLSALHARIPLLQALLAPTAKTSP